MVNIYWEFKKIILLSICCMSFNNAYSLTQSEEEIITDNFWIETGAGEKELRSCLGDQCYKDEIEFISCISGVDSLVQAISINDRFGPTDYWQTMPDQVQNVKNTFNSFQLVLTSPQKQPIVKSSKEAAEVLIKEKRNFHQFIREQYKKKNLDFSLLTTLLLDLSKTRWGVHAELMAFRYYVNSYLSIRDSISKIEPLSYYTWRSAQTSNNGLSMDTIFIDSSLLIKKIPQSSDFYKLGLQQGDRILEINNLKFSEHSIKEFSQAIETASNYSIVVKKKDGSIQHINNVPANLNKDTVNNIVTYNKIQHKNKNYRHIKISTFFSTQVCALLEKELAQDSSLDQVSGFIIDLRDNGGGHLTQTTCIASLFLEDHRVVFFERPLESDVKTAIYTNTTFVNKNLQKAPIVILVNGHSASSSELLTGALREYSRALVVGQRTYGKGSLNRALYLNSDALLILWKTIEVFYFPNLKTNNRVGIIPDFIVPWRTGAKEDEDFYFTSEMNDSNPTKPENDAIPPKDLIFNTQVNSCLDQKWIHGEEDRLFGTTVGSDLQLIFGIETLRCFSELTNYTALVAETGGSESQGVSKSPSENSPRK